MYIIYNPASGRQDMKKLLSVQQALAKHHVFPQFLITEYAGHATELARSVSGQEGVTVVAAGGDGTIAEVVSGLVGSRARLGLIPLGTANVLARELGIPAAPDTIAEILATSGGRILWPGCLYDTSGIRKIFVQMASVGFDACVVHNVNYSLKKRIGRYAYVFQMIHDLFFYDFSSVRMEIDGETCSATGAIVSKGCFYGGGYRITDCADPSEKGFVVILFEKGGIFSVLRYGHAILRNKLGDLPDVRVIRARQVKIMGSSSIPLQADGDTAGFAPVMIKDAEAPLLVASA